MNSNILKEILIKQVDHKRKGYVSKSNATHTNASQKTNGNIYINAPKAAATIIGARASKVFRGFSIAAPDPIPPVVYMNWKLRSVELKQLSRVTVSISGSSTSAKTISTHYPFYQ
jgi:hypothetical protein